MEIKDVSGNTLVSFDNNKKLLKDALAEAVAKDNDLSYAVLNGADLSSVDLSGVDLSYAYLMGANLNNAYLSGAKTNGADLMCADLSSVDLSGVDLSYAYLMGANLSNANLSGANLRCIDLWCANLSGANLRDANLRGADLRGADLSNADLSGAYLRGAILIGARNVPDLPMVCPKEGSFIGWKKIWIDKEGYRGVFIVKLEIPEDAKRSSATSNKCRCSKAKVLEIKNIETGECVDTITSLYITSCVYKVGEYVYPDSFDEDRWKECSNGIHFFMTEKEAKEY